jgi:hypothetical protein
MAEKTPDSVRRENLGSVNLLIGAYITENIDDNDTWDCGIPKSKMVSWPKFVPAIDGPQDCAIDAISDDGVLTFGSAANQNGYVEIMFKDM